jgi:methylmalonyl-CoA mutase N-terminal domain/subunit
MSKDEKIFTRYLEGERPPNYKTLSGIELKEFYTSQDAPDSGPSPGEYPFTRGIHREMYRKRFWTRRQQSGFGTPRESNQRLLYLLEQGQTGLNVDTDMGSKLGLDPDHELARGDVGLQGTSVITFQDMEELFRDIPLDKVSTTLIVQPPYSAVIMAMYLLLARRQGVPESSLIGTIMNCPITQLAGPAFQAATHFFLIERAVKIGLDTMEYCVRNIPKWNIVNINAYNIRETGVNAFQEGAFALSLGADYVQRLLKRGLDIDDFAPRIAFFTAAHIDFFEEIAKIGAMRRIWARMMKERFGAKEKRSCWFRTAIQTSALPLTAQQPLNNIVRATVQTLAAALAGTQSIHTTSYDEAYSLPTEESHRLSIRTQQILAYETNVVKTADPLGGSHFVEWLTDRAEEEILSIMDLIQDKGGFIKCFMDGWVEDQIREARYKYSQEMEEGQQLSVGVNTFREEDEEVNIKIFRHSTEMQKERIEYIERYKKERDQGPVDRALDALYEKSTADGDSNIFIPIMEAVEAGATMGEISDTLRRAENFEIPV